MNDPTEHPSFARIVLEQWFVENSIEAQDGRWKDQSVERMKRAISYAKDTLGLDELVSEQND